MGQRKTKRQTLELEGEMGEGRERLEWTFGEVGASSLCTATPWLSYSKSDFSFSLIARSIPSLLRKAFLKVTVKSNGEN